MYLLGVRFSLSINIKLIQRLKIIRKYPTTSHKRSFEFSLIHRLDDIFLPLFHIARWKWGSTCSSLLSLVGCFKNMDFGPSKGCCSWLPIWLEFFSRILLFIEATWCLLGESETSSNRLELFFLWSWGVHILHRDRVDLEVIRIVLTFFVFEALPLMEYSISSRWA